VLKRFCELKQIHLEEAVEHVRNPRRSDAAHPFDKKLGEERGRKRKQETTEKGRVRPKHCASEEKSAKEICL
jgi:hypothetical protein